MPFVADGVSSELAHSDNIDQLVNSIEQLPIGQSIPTDSDENPYEPAGEEHLTLPATRKQRKQENLAPQYSRAARERADSAKEMPSEYASAGPGPEQVALSGLNSRQKLKPKSLIKVGSTSAVLAAARQELAEMGARSSVLTRRSAENHQDAARQAGLQLSGAKPDSGILRRSVATPLSLRPTEFRTASAKKQVQFSNAAQPSGRLPRPPVEINDAILAQALASPGERLSLQAPPAESRRSIEKRLAQTRREQEDNLTKLKTRVQLLNRQERQTQAKIKQAQTYAQKVALVRKLQDERESTLDRASKERSIETLTRAIGVEQARQRHKEALDKATQAKTIETLLDSISVKRSKEAIMRQKELDQAQEEERLRQRQQALMETKATHFLQSQQRARRKAEAQQKLHAQAVDQSVEAISALISEQQAAE